MISHDQLGSSGTASMASLMFPLLFFSTRLAKFVLQTLAIFFRLPLEILTKWSIDGRNALHEADVLRIFAEC